VTPDLASLDPATLHSPALLLSIPAVAAALSWVLTRAALGYLRRRAILDHPNERSSHTVPTPRGGGWGIVLTLLPAAALAAVALDDLRGLGPVLLGATLLAGVSWADDRRGLGPGGRLLAQAAAVAAGLAALPPDGLVLQGLVGWWPDRVLAALAWVWFVNLYNFMDGIDGLAGTETATIGLGVALVAGLAGLGPLPVWAGLAAAGAALGFLAWNWQPARIFMGDVGSVPLGYALGWLLLGLAAAGHWAAALLLPAYFLADATITLCRRLLRGEKVWRPHREHFYQRAVRAGRSHAEVVRSVLAANLALVALALLSVGAGAWPVLGGAAVVAALLARLSRR
jgi:UDP-N-acetylmuramyl pentapeptide phosphotransferase/UDP-N-acetylglucosamine-1-phosphate transferase